MCPRCGAENASGMTFCTNCGRSISSGANSNSSSLNSKTKNPNNTLIEQVNSSALDEIRSLKQVGAFRQTEVKDVPAGDFYPFAGEAVQVAYQIFSELFGRVFQRK